MVPHARTLRKARMQVQLMIYTGFSTRSIRAYLHRYILWWVNASTTWLYHELIEWFIETCWDLYPAAYAAGLRQRYFMQSNTRTLLGVQIAA